MAIFHTKRRTDMSTYVKDNTLNTALQLLQIIASGRSFNVEKGQKMYLSSKVVNAVKKIMKLIEWDNS